MAQKRKQYVKLANGKLEQQMIATSADIVEIEAIDGITATNVQGALEEIKTIADAGGAAAKALEGVQGQVTKLVGDDANKSVRTIANEELATQLVAPGAAASLDSLLEIAQWIQSHPQDAAAMNKKIADLETADAQNVKLTGDQTIAGTKKFNEPPEFLDGALIASGVPLRFETEPNGGTGYVSLVADDRDTTHTVTLPATGGTLALDTIATQSAKGLMSAADKTRLDELYDEEETATYCAVTVNEKGRVIRGGHIVEWGTDGQTTPSASLVVGGLFFELVE